MKKGMTIGALALCIVLGAAVVAVLLTSANAKKKYEKQIEELNFQVGDLQFQVDELGATETCWQLAHDVKSGTQVKETDLIPVEVPLTMSGGYVHNLQEAVGKYYKISFDTGTTLSADMLFDFEVTKDMRYLDVVCDELPIGLEEDDYIDLRVSFTLGQDFIAMTNKRVAAIYGNTVKLIVDNKDIYTYESIKVDKAIYKGVRLYCVEYIEGVAQGAATKYYPLRVDVLATVVQDPNIDGDLEQYTYADRSYLEAQLSVDKETMESIQNGKDKISNMYQESIRIYNQIMEEQRKKAEEEARIAAEQAAMGN